MRMPRRLALSALAPHIGPLVVALSTSMLMCASAYAVSFGHSRIASNPGQPLQIDVPVTHLTADDLRTLEVRPAVASAWAQAGLTPPVDLNTMRVRVVNGFTPGAKVVQIRSTQAFSGPVADLLLNVSTASGRQQYQVSLLAPTRSGAFGSMEAAQTGAAASGAHSSARRAQGAVRIRHGDTLWAIARRHAVPGVSIYQMMVALQRANPQAFIHHNLNLIKTGATLSIPDRAALTVVSDREARRIFEQQLNAFMKYRQGLASGSADLVQGGAANKGQVLPAAPQTRRGAESAAPRDQLKLSTARSGADESSDNRAATQKGIADSQARVSTLEENVKHLNQALQLQGKAATDAVIGGAKGLGQSFSDVAGAVAGIMAPGASTAADSPKTATPPAAAGPSAASGTSKASGSSNPPFASGSSAGSAGAGGSSGAAAHSPGAVAGSPGAAGAISSAGSSGLTGSTGVAGSASAGSSNGAGSSASTGASSVSNSSSSPQSQAQGGASNAASAGGAPNSSAGAGNAAAGSPGASGNTKASGSSNPSSASGGSAGSADVGGSSGAAANSSGSASAGSSNGARSSTSTGGSGVPNSSSSSQPQAQGGASNAAGVGGAPNSSAGTGGGAANPASAAKKEAAPGEAAKSSPDVAPLIAPQTPQAVSWFQEHLLGLITALLALIVLLIAWALRRANGSHDDRGDHGLLVTEAMVKEKLDKINLDLRHPVSGEPHLGEPESPDEPETSKT